MILSEETNIYDDNAIAKKIESNKSSLEILQDRISSVVTKTEVETSKREEADAKVKILSTKVTQDAEKIDTVVSRMDSQDALIRLDSAGVEVGLKGPDGNFAGHRTVAGIDAFSILSKDGEKLSSFDDDSVDYYSDGIVYGSIQKNDYTFDPSNFESEDDGHGLTMLCRNGNFYSAQNTKVTVPQGSDANNRVAYATFSNIARAYDSDPEKDIVLDNLGEYAAIDGRSYKYSNDTYVSSLGLSAHGKSGTAEIAITDFADQSQFPNIYLHTGSGSVSRSLEVGLDGISIIGDAIIDGESNMKGSITASGDISTSGSVSASGHLVTGSGDNIFSISTSIFTDGGETHGSLLHKNGVVVLTPDYSSYKPVYASDFVKSSSRVAKENIKEESEESARRILGLRIVSFDYKKGFSDEKSRFNHRGVIAEEAAEVMPEIVKIPEGWDEAAYKGGLFVPSVDYTDIIPDLIKMVQVQQAEIDSLKDEIEALKMGKMKGDSE